jgi:hypothetical protein
MKTETTKYIELEPFILQQEFFGAGPGCGTIKQVKLSYQLGQFVLFVISDITNKVNCPN